MEAVLHGHVSMLQPRQLQNVLIASNSAVMTMHGKLAEASENGLPSSSASPVESQKDTRSAVGADEL